MSTKEIQIDKGQLRLLHSIPSPAAVIDEDGNLVITNEEWNNCSETSHLLQCITSANNLFECFREAAETGSDDALKVIIGLRRVLDNETEAFEAQYLNRIEGERQWFNISIRGFDSHYAIFYAQEVTKHMRAFQELRDSRERYQQQFNHSLNGIIIGTPGGRIIDVNPSACKILGYSREELIKGGRDLILDPENPINMKAHSIREQQSFFEGEKRYIRKNGREIPVMMSSVLFRDKDGELSIINSFRDISKEKKIQKKLKNEQEFAQSTIASIPGTFYVLDTDGTFLQWNDAFIDELGYSEEDMFGMKPAELFHAEDKNLISSKLDEVLRTGKTHTVARVLTKDGEERLFKLNARTFRNDDVTYIIGTGMDITELVDAKLSSERHFRLMDQLFENAPIGIVMIDKDNRISRVNDGFREMFGYVNGDSDVVGADVNDLITNDETHETADRVSREAFKGKPSQFESVRYTRDGEEVPVLISTTPVSDGENVIAVYGIYVDLKEQKKLEMQITDLLQREREAREKAQNSLKEKEILLQEIHHRVKNNLAVIAGLIDLQLLEELDDNAFKKLSEVQSRIFSIAKIHETLYQEKNVVNIRFDNYLKSFVKFLPQQGFRKEVVSELRLECNETILNLNQAVPAGLMVNELINVLLPENKQGALNMNLTSSDESVKITLQGCGLKLNKFMENLDSEQFQYKLVDILVAQLNGTIDVNLDANFVSVVFQKNNAKGSSNAFF